MNLRLRQLLSKQTFTNLKRITTFSTSSSSSSSSIFASHNNNSNKNNPNHSKIFLGTFPFLSTQRKCFHSSPQFNHSLSASPVSISDDVEEEEAAMNEFLSRFVHLMRGKLNEAYPDCDKPTIDAMLSVIVEKLATEMEGNGGNWGEKPASSDADFSDDLWTTVWEVSNNVCKEMEREEKKEKMKKYLQSEDVKAMARFASEMGVRGDMLRELRFKWAREAMEKAEFYQGLEKLEQTAKEKQVRESPVAGADAGGGGDELEASFGAKGGLPKRHGKIKYKLYGLDLSGQQWKEVADNIHEAEEIIWPQEAKPITGKCELVTEKILSLQKGDDYESVIFPLLNQWKELLQPNRVDWISLLEKLKERDCSLHLKVVEHVLDEPSFVASIRDYSKLIDAHAKENRLEDIERILKKMNKSGMEPDIVTLTVLFYAYSKANNFEKAKETYETLTSQGFRPDLELYNSMIMLYVNADQPKEAEKLMRKMEFDIKPTEDIYMALLRSFAEKGDSVSAKRIETNMQFAGYQPTAESCTLLVQACGISGDSDEARFKFDYMKQLGFKPDDRCTSLMIFAYQKKNELDKALDLLLQLEKEGFEPGVSTYSALVDWFGKLQLVDEAEQMLVKIAQLGEVPPFKIQVSLCDMYARAGIEKKALQALGILEAKKDLLEHRDFERIIQALIKGQFMQHAHRMVEVMKAQGYTESEQLRMGLTAQKIRQGGDMRDRK